MAALQQSCFFSYTLLQKNGNHQDNQLRKNINKQLRH